MICFPPKSNWIVTIAAAVAILSACAPDFSDDVCTTNEDCFANEICLANTCVVTTENNDVGNNTQDTQSADTEHDTNTEDDTHEDPDSGPIPSRNACNGTTRLDHEPGEPCGPCNLDKYICDGTDNTICDGETPCPESTLITTNPSDITPTGATFHGKTQELTADLPTDHGFCWSTDVLPTQDNGTCHSLGALTATDNDKAFEHTVNTLNQGTIYHVRVFYIDSTGTNYANVASFNTLAPVPTSFTATQGTETAFVKLTWDDMPGTTQYQLFRNDIMIAEVDADTTFFNDESAAPAELTAPQSPAASQGTSPTAVILSANPSLPTPGTSLPYTLLARYPDLDSTNAPETNGYRGVGPITYQWERSASDTDADFSPLTGATDLNAQDTTAPTNGDTRFYRITASAPGTQPQTSTHVSGFRKLSSIPTNVTASTNNTEYVTVSWDAVTDAASYELFRDGISIATNLQSTSYNDTDADAPPPATAPTLTASTTPGPHVTLNWAEATTAPGTTHQYTVIAIEADNTESAPSAVATGNRAPRTITGYEIQRDGGTWTDVGLTTTYNDTTALPPVIATPVTIELTTSGTTGRYAPTVPPTLADGTAITYIVHAVTDTTNGTPSSPVSGYRKAGPLEFQWQELDADETTFNDISGATNSFYEVDPVDPGRTFRLRLHSQGAADVFSNAN